jgi:hypothetical protein
VLVANGQLGDPNDDFFAMDDFLYATPSASATAKPEPGSLGLLGCGLFAFGLGAQGAERPREPKLLTYY